MQSKRMLLETVLVLCLSLGGMLLLPIAKALFGLLPIVYLLIECRLRHRTWSELGFKSGTFWQDLRANWLWVVLAGFVTQSVPVLWARAYFPEYLMHVQARLPFGDALNWAVLLPILAVSTLGEELAYRVLFQGRLTPYLGAPAAIVIVSLLFALAHFAPGPAAILALDLGLIFLDALLYGAVYSRGNNVLVSWAAHLLGDLVGLAMLVYLF